MSPAGLELVVLAGAHDVDGLLRITLSLAVAHLGPLTRVHLVTPDPNAAREIAHWVATGAGVSLEVWGDAQICPEAAHLPPWFRQQYLKLHADRLVASPRVIVLGADTLVLDPVGEADLTDADGLPLLRWFRYDRPNRHLPFERRRVLNVARLLDVTPRRSLLLGDFICDLFLFDVGLLRGLRQRFAAGGGLLSVLEALGPRQGADDRFGEWTAYAVHCLETPGTPVTPRLSGPDFFGQLHSPWELRRPDRYIPKIVHFVWKPPDVGLVLDDLAQCGRLPVVLG